jgi:hypothetical protein
MSSDRQAEMGAEGFRPLTGWSGTERDRRNKLAHFRWGLLLAASLVASSLMLRAGLGGGGALKWVIAALPIALLAPWLSAYLRFLREADELLRKIQLEGIAVGFWTGMSFGIGYIVLEDAGLPRLQTSEAVAIMAALMGVGYAFGRFLASKRYR